MSLEYAEARQWAFVEDILQAHVVSYMPRAVQSPAVTNVFRQSTAEETQETIDTLLTLKDKGVYHEEAYGKHKETTRLDDEGITIALIIGIVVLFILLVTIVLKVRSGRKDSGERGTLVNDTSIRSDRPR